MFFIIYLLEDEQELSLGMLDTSPTYLYFFIVPCYYIICVGCLMGFIMHFYIIFGTNLLTEGPVQISVFYLVFEIYRKGIPNGVQLTCQFLTIFYGTKEAPGVKELGQKSPGLSTRVGGAPTP